MDPTALAGMLFVLIIIAMVGGFILLLPLTRRLGLLLEERIGKDRTVQGANEDLRELHTAIQALQRQLEEVAERQEFTERLLTERQADSPALPGAQANP